MSIKEQVERDLKQAMLSGDKTLVTTLRGLKSNILNEEVAQHKRDEGLEDQEVVRILRKESKKREESATLYKQGGSQSRAEAELQEKEVISHYLPAELSDEVLQEAVSKAVTSIGELTPQTMGRIIGMVKTETEGQIDSSRIVAAVKERLSS